jgi:acylphosphatase
MSDLVSIKVIVHGRVQGVYFRMFVEEKATELGLTGYVRNLPDGRSVETLVEGEKTQLERLTAFLKTGPPPSKVSKVEVSWSEYTGNYQDFSIKY